MDGGVEPTGTYLRRLYVTRAGAASYKKLAERGLSIAFAQRRLVWFNLLLVDRFQSALQKHADFEALYLPVASMTLRASGPRSRR